MKKLIKQETNKSNEIECTFEILCQASEDISKTITQGNILKIENSIVHLLIPFVKNMLKKLGMVQQFITSFCGYLPICLYQ